ncbi:MAG TPA: hypothetical protein VLV83_19840, partial [Acidobacteriota bacterium]|nr:hypothetical protein [Acidobacteriota bacterium]
MLTYLFPTDANLPDELPLDRAWKNRDGYFVFLSALPSPDRVNALVDALWGILQTPAHASFAWAAGDPDDPPSLAIESVLLKSSAADTARIDGSASHSLSFRQWTLLFVNDDPVTLQNQASEAPYLLFANAFGRIRLLPGDGKPGVELDETRLDLTGDALGYQRFVTAFGSSEVDADGFDVACRYAIPGDNGNGSARSLCYPVFELGDGQMLDLTVRLNPIFPHDSHFFIDQSTGTVGSFFRTVDGDALTLAPRSGATLDLSVRPGPDGDGFFYLVPVGEFSLGMEGTVSAPELLCGLAGTETLALNLGGESGDVFAFFRDMGAFAKGFGTGQTERGELLGSAYTTAWVAVGPPSSAAQNPYYAQPDGAPLHSISTPVGPPERGFLGFLQTPSAIFAVSVSQDTSFPLTALAGARPDREEGIEAATYRTLEQEVISPSRRHQIDRFTGQAQRTKGAAATAATVAGTTPQGLIARLPSTSLKSAGAASVQGWEQVDLAKNSDETLGQTLQLLVGQPTAAFQNALQSSKLFLVVSKAGVMGAFANQISIGGWPFNIDIGASATTEPAEGEIDNILIFKFYDEKIEALTDNLGTWSDPDLFNDDEERADEVQAFLKSFFSGAREKAKSQPELYGPFVENVLDRPNWAGVLALNVKLPVGDLPQEVQGLLGGIKKPDRFKAHHLGIEITQTGPSGEDQEKSSLFALLDYQDDGTEQGRVALSAADDPGTYDFTVKTLQILFTNTEISEFKSRIQLTMNKLFDEAADLEPAIPEEPPNTIELEGSYERHDTDDGGSQATYTFLYEGERTFSISSAVLESVTLEKVQFTTSSTETEGGVATIRSGFAFWGNLAFGSLGNFDFFSFDSLEFAELSLGMSFQVRDGRVVEGSRKFDFDPGNLRFNISFSQTRQDSLLGNFPLRLNGFVFNTREGQSVNDLGFINVPGLVPLPSSLPTTNAPLYALTLSLNLGSMGSLVSETKGFAIEVLAGWTPSSNGDPNRLAFGIKLPQSTGGGKEIGIQGVLTLSMEDFGFLKVPESASPGEDFLYALYLNKAVLKVLGTQIPPGLNFSTLLFIPFQGGTSPDLSNLGWFVAFEPTEEEDQQLALTDGQVEALAKDKKKILQLDYLGIGQRIAIDLSDADTVEAVIEAMQDLIPANKKGDELQKQLSELYNADAGWLVGIDFTIYETLRLAAVFAEVNNVYGLLVGFKAPEKLKNFQFQILYKKINDSVGVYKIVLQLPDALRNQQFGAVGFTIPDFKLDVYTNGDFKVDVGYPNGLDFSDSFSVQAQAGPVPVIGFGGFFFAKLSSATSDTVPDIDPSVGTFDPVIEAGFGLSLGVGKTIDKGIFRAGLSVTFVGILEGTAAWFIPAEEAARLKAADGSLGEGALSEVTALSAMFDGPPDFYRVKGVFALVGMLYGEVDFGIVKAGISLTIWASLSVTFEAYASLDLEIAAGVKVKVTVVIGSFKIFGKKIEIKISFSFSTEIRYTFSIEDKRTPPWGRVAGAGEIELTVGESDPDSGPRLSLNAAEGIDYRWSLAVPFTARRVPTES